MQEHLGIFIETLSAWPLGIDTVLEPLFEGCKKYAKNKLEKA